MAVNAGAVSGVAQRYATALFDLADEAKALDQVADDLRGVRAALAESDDLRRLLTSPALSRDAQSSAMAAILEAGGAGELTRKFVGLVAYNRRLFVLPVMIEAYLAELARRRGEMTARVRSAHPLSDQQQSALIDQLKTSFGVKVDMDLTVDPALLGGMVIQVGSRMIDNSLRSKLDRMQIALKAG